MSQGGLPNEPDGALVRAPELPTDVDAAPLKLDPKVGEEAFSRQVAALRAMAPADVVLPNSDVSVAALQALQLVRTTREPSRVERFNEVRALLRESTPEALEEQAWVVWYLDTRAKSVRASRSKAKVDGALVKEAKSARTRVLKLLRFHFEDNELMTAELRDISMGSGFVDIAQDLTRLAGHVSVHKDALCRYPKNYSADDEWRLRGLANEIIAQLNNVHCNETADLRNRAWTRMVLTYGHVKAAADLIYYNMPAELGFFPALRAAVLAKSGRPRRPRKQKGAVSEPGDVAPHPGGSLAASPESELPDESSHESGA